MRSALRIEAYFEHIQAVINGAPVVAYSNVQYDKRSPSLGFLRGELTTVDGTILHVREFIDVERGVNRITYAYQYMGTEHQLVFRYDNADDLHSRLHLSTHPHHKHDGSQENVVASHAPTLAQVLDEIEQLVKLP